MKITSVADLTVGMVGWFWCTDYETGGEGPTAAWSRASTGRAVVGAPSPVQAATVARQWPGEWRNTDFDFGGGEGYEVTTDSDFAWAFHTGEGAEGEARTDRPWRGVGAGQ